jgi:glycosyltransferase involved in cell wall biosynthesis
MVSSKQQSVLFICSQRWGGGPSVFLRLACEHLPRFGWTCKLLLTGTKKKTLFDSSGWPCEVQVLEPSYSWIEHAQKVGWAIASFNPAVVVGMAIHAPALAMRYLYQSGDLRYRLLDTVLSDTLFEYDRIRMNADVVTTVGAISNALTQSLRIQVPEVATRTARIIFPVTHLKDLLERSKPNGTLRLAYVGRIAQHDKRILDFIPLVNELISKRLRFILTFIGDGPQMRELQNGLSRIPGTLERISFLGRVSNNKVLHILKEQDALLLMSEVEGQPFSLLEAMGAGVIPVVTDLSGTREIVADGESGFLLGQGKIEEFANKLLQLASSPTMLKRMSQSAWKTVQKQHSCNAAIGVLAALLDRSSKAQLPPIVRRNDSRLRLPSDNLMSRLHIPHSLQGIKRELLGHEIH